MKSFALATTLAALAFREASAHATFQALWVDGVDYAGQCVRQPPSNSPVTDVTSDDIACNAGTSPVSSICPVPAGSTVTVEMHQQITRSCDDEAIGGAHYGPVAVYLAEVSDATTASGASSAWFKIFEDGWASDPSGASGDDDRWGTKDLNACCGKMDVVVPSTLRDGDYLLRAEALALHAAATAAGAQFYMSCYQISVSGGSGSASPPTVGLPGAYDPSDPGILVNIHAALAGYDPPGPAVFQDGTTKEAGSACAGCEATCSYGDGEPGTATAATPSSTGTDGGDDGGCTASTYDQCGGIGWTGCTACSGSTCTYLNDYYSQCQ
ncbi:hypothetical protein MKZ38_009291 [Zalerion maritima]|uniref:lytic cellulose monooxygenase (C4-dehydrogenating) n=1 Tax=Zalerion maritima TaxID=339359 RepID=A0AAD5RV70_9PEZI|nr:hypothetical protein MKZ38_009291 [Zalerion maritima]